MSFDVRMDNQIYGAWTTINNTFTIIDPAAWPRLQKYWNGVLIQLGDHTDAQAGGTMDEFQHVLLKLGGATVVDLLRQEFSDSTMWVNVVADRNPSPRDAPMRRWDLGELLVERMGSPPHPYTLRKHFDPFAGCITIWIDRDDGFTVAGDRGTNERMQYTFTLPMVAATVLRVRVHKDGNLIHDFGAADVDEIQITGRAGGGPGDDKNPPQMGGPG